ncbi:MAG: hypothetical protein ACHREM_03180 [Polyangiales bacterium]
MIALRARSLVRGAIVVASAAGLSISTARAHASGSTQDEGTSDSTPFRPRLVGDLRLLMLDRNETNFVAHANTYAYSMGSTAGGVRLDLGVELLPRVSLLASAHYAIDGADRDSAQLRVQSAAAIGLLRWTFVDASIAPVRLRASALGGFGRYVIKQTYIDPAIAPTTYEQDAGSYGGTLGVDASLFVMGFTAVVGYAYHYAPASVSDRIGGTVQAGGHEISLGVGIDL